MKRVLMLVALLAAAACSEPPVGPVALNTRSILIIGDTVDKCPPQTDSLTFCQMKERKFKSK